jgi:hypothetical protein
MKTRTFTDGDKADKACLRIIVRTGNYNAARVYFDDEKKFHLEIYHEGKLPPRKPITQQFIREYTPWQYS